MIKSLLSKSLISNKIKAALFIALVCAAGWDVWVHRQVTSAQETRYDRAQYYTKEARRPYLFQSRYTLSNETMDHTIRIEVIEAEDSRGRVFYTRKNFTSASDTSPTIESGRIIEPPDGSITTFFWSKWQDTLHRPMLVAYGTDRRLLHAHARPENNCVAPEPALKLLRQESVRIGAQDYPAAVVETRDDVGTQTTWYSLSPGLGCLELKSIANYVDPDHKKGTTVHEPVSMSLGEPDTNQIDISGRIARTSTEVVPLGSWESTIKARSAEYQRLAER